jgi:hypothetical protein
MSSHAIIFLQASSSHAICLCHASCTLHNAISNPV